MNQLRERGSWAALRTREEVAQDKKQRCPLCGSGEIEIHYVDDGIEPDTLGLFVGGEFAHQDDVPLPAQIILYLENIYNMVEVDEEEFCIEVHITYLHELGHYLRLNEEELEERGLL